MSILLILSWSIDLFFKQTLWKQFFFCEICFVISGSNSKSSSSGGGGGGSNVLLI